MATEQQEGLASDHLGRDIGQTLVSDAALLLLHTVRQVRGVGLKEQRVTWLMHRTGVAQSQLRRCSVEDTLSICLVFSCHSAAWNSPLNTAASESSTSRRTSPRASSRGTRRQRHRWRESCR